MGAPSDNSYFKSWYAANKEAFNLKRRKAYANSKDKRDKAVKYQKNYRATRATKSSNDSGRKHFREVNGANVEVHRIAAAAELAGCSVEFIRKYEKAGVIPAPVVGSKQRYYTPSQVALIKDLFDLMVQLKYNKDASLKALALQQQTQTISTSWTGE